MTDELPAHCQNCDAELKGKFCHHCGQKQIEPTEKKFTHFIFQFFGSAFFLENNFLKNLWTLLVKPGRIALDFIEGRRKRWMPPFSLFLLINLFYFWYSPLTDMNLSLGEHMEQYHGPIAKSMVKQRLESRDVTFADYASVYNAKSSAYSNSLIVLQVPLFALFLAMILYRNRYYYVDHFIFSLNLFAFVLLLALVGVGLVITIGALPRLNETSVFYVLRAAVLLAIIGYFFFALHRVYKRKIWATALLMVPVFVAFVVSHFIYRAIQFLILFALT